MIDIEPFKLVYRVAAIMKKAAFPWFIAGGWAIDLFLKRVTREHTDIEIAIFRVDQLACQDHMQGWEFKKVRRISVDEPGLLEVWNRGEYLYPPVHEIHAFNRGFSPGELEILLDERDEFYWIFRRNREIKRKLPKVVLYTVDRIPFLAPEIVLLYKSKAPKTFDDADFRNVHENLKKESRVWLRSSIKHIYPDHTWLSVL